MDSHLVRSYLKSHSWITFTLNLGRLTSRNWMRIGEALSKCDHLSGVPLAPRVAAKLHRIYLAKGVHATTSIEGNTLSESEVIARLAGDLPLPESQDYLGVEVDNIFNACEIIIQELVDGADLTLTPSRISQFNEIVLRGLPLEDGVVPGQIRAHPVTVGAVYRGAPAEDCDYLIERLCRWLKELQLDADKQGFGRPMKLIIPILAHLYIAWIHPFGDGNGRTARLVEFQLLAAAGLPTPACHLLSNYYNRTRTRYYAVLKETSRNESFPVETFVSYALDGLVEELREQLKTVRHHQFTVAWVNYVHGLFRGRGGSNKDRQRELVLSLPSGKFTPVQEVPELTVRLAGYYHGKQMKTVTRDVNVLVELELIEHRRGSGVRPRVEVVEAFLPVRADAENLMLPQTSVTANIGLHDM